MLHMIDLRQPPPGARGAGRTRARIACAALAVAIFAFSAPSALSAVRFFSLRQSETQQSPAWTNARGLSAYFWNLSGV